LEEADHAQFEDTILQSSYNEREKLQKTSTNLWPEGCELSTSGI